MLFLPPEAPAGIYLSSKSGYPPNKSLKNADFNLRRDYALGMRSQTLRIGLLAAALAAPSAAWSQTAATRTITIHVIDVSGANVQHAEIRLTPAPDPAPAKIETDENGNFSLNLKPGTYSLVVSQAGFRKWAEAIYVAKPEGGASQLVPVVLQIATFGGPIAVYPPDSLVLNAPASHEPVVLLPVEFHAFPHITIKVHNSHKDVDENYSGVPLATLLAKVNAPVGKQLQKEAFMNYIIAVGSDGYSVVLSLAEVDPSFRSGQVIVADARDGQPLGTSGSFELVVSEDKRPARWVHNLSSIWLQGPR
jgi:hypothetical protein